MSLVLQKGLRAENLRHSRPSKVVDTRGQCCPYPMVEARKAISALAPGEVLDIITDVEGTATTSIPLVSETLNCDCVVLSDGDKWRVRVSK